MAGSAPDREPFRELLDASVAEQAVAARARERLLRQRAEEGARFAGTLRDIAEAGGVVTVRTEAGVAHQGRLVAVGLDHCAVATVRGPVVFVALDAVALVRPEPGAAHAAATGERDAAQDRTLLEVLARLVDDRPRVALLARGSPEPVTGELRAVGEDVVTVRLDGDTRGTAYVRAAAITELVVVG